MDVLSFSETGGHPHNEDAFAVAYHPLDPAVVVCVVADGQGGQPGGGPAAKLACQTAIEMVSKLPPDRLGDPLTWSGLLRVVDEAVRADRVAGFTTFVGLCVFGGRVVGVSSGDSAALLVAGGRAVELTRGQHKNPPVGSGAARPVPFDAASDAPRVLVMTDGVWKYVGWQRVTETAHRDRGAALLASLQRDARLPGSGRFQDDFTVVLLE